MSIKDRGQTKVLTERRTFKINCWEKMQTKCFCYCERQNLEGRIVPVNAHADLKFG